MYALARSHLAYASASETAAAVRVRLRVRVDAGNVNLLRLIASALASSMIKFDLALFQRLLQSSQLLAAHPRGCDFFVVGSAVTESP